MVACRSKNWTNKRRLRVEGDSGWSRWSRMMVGDPGCQAGRSPPVLLNTLVTRHHLHSTEKGEKFQNENELLRRTSDCLSPLSPWKACTTRWTRAALGPFNLVRVEIGVCCRDTNFYT